MNPPSVLQGAMGRERKPFTYTPGGLDLSEIKSERMAKRLMRNAMNQGVPEVPVHQVQSPPAPSTPIAVPNFNCLPVQVFPAFNMPANPRSLLRTRSHPEQPKDPILRKEQPNQFGNIYKQSFQQSPLIPQPETAQSALESLPSFNNNFDNNMNTQVSMFDNHSNKANYGSVTFTAPELPEMSYEAEYFQTKPNLITNNFAPCEISENVGPSFTNIENSVPEVKPSPETIVVPIESKEEIIMVNEDDQREVRVVKKKETETKSENHNGHQNGKHNGDSEAAVTVKIPTKKAAAKTETKVEVVQRTLPDGSLEEVKTTTTKTTIDGKTQITTKTETTIIPKDDDEEEYEEVEEEEQEEDVQEVKTNESETSEKPTTIILKKSDTSNSSEVKENGQSDVLITNEESSKISSSKKVIVTQNNDEEELEEEVIEEEVINTKPIDQDETTEVETEVSIVLNTSSKSAVTKSEIQEKVQENPEEEENTEILVSAKLDEPPKQEDKILKTEEPKDTETELESVVQTNLESKQNNEKEEENESEYTEEEYESEVEQTTDKVKEAEKSIEESHESTGTNEVKETKDKVLELTPVFEEKSITPSEISEPQEHNVEISYSNVPLREPSIPLEKVEDVEIKPLGAKSDNVVKTHTENTEIIASTNDKSSGVLSTQTEYNRVENIVTVNRTTKTLDQSYEQLTQQSVPTMKSYFAPNRENVSISPSKPYQSTYTPEPQQERRHSLLLERLSMERQSTPAESSYQNNYQYTNQGFENQRQWSQEPQSEVVNVSNVKPSKITNQEWFKQSIKDNVNYNDATVPSTLNVPLPAFNQPQPQSPTIPQYKPLPPQPQYQQPQYTAPQPKCEKPQYHYQAQHQPKPKQQSQTQNTASPVQDYSRTSSNVYKQQTSYPPYIPQSTTTWENNSNTLSTNTQSNQYSFSNQTSESYQKSSQQYSSSYVPPPWEQDSTYNGVNVSNQNQYLPPAPAQTLTPTPSFAPSNNQSWQPTKLQSKFSKTNPTSYTPPAPNQSFVKSDNEAEPPNQPGRTTYYSEYERRYITVPESTYIPAETKFQAQPDPSPQYYFDKNEPVETVEPQWRKELREFTEKSQTYQSEQTSVKPPWEEEVQYTKNPSVKYTPTPSWSQTLRPQSWRERSFEAESAAMQDFSKTSTLNRGRPSSTYMSNDMDNSSQRSRGMSVDRYNPVYYRSPIPSEHPPAQVQTLTPETAPHPKGHQHPVPAYNSRASAEPRDQPAQFHQKRYREVKENPVQSRSFKYLQWITGTED